MRTPRLFLAALALLAASAAGAAPQIGQPAPAFSLASAEGPAVALAQFKGRYVVLEWTNHECPFVQKHYRSGNMQALQKELTGQDAVWLSVISSAPGKQGHVDAAQARELTSARGAAPTAVLFDPSGEIGRRYGAKTTPHMYLVNPEGTLVYMGGIDSIPSSDAGDIDRATPYVKVAFAEARAGKPVSNPSTRPYGCAVKY